MGEHREDFPFGSFEQCALLLQGARSPKCFARVRAAGDGQTSLDRAGAQCPTAAGGVGMENRLLWGGGGWWAGLSYKLGWRQEPCEVPAVAGLGKREGDVTSDAE